MERIGIFLAIGVAVCWGSADVCATLGSRRLGTVTTTFISLLVSVVTLTFLGVIAFGRLALTPQMFVLSIPPDRCYKHCGDDQFNLYTHSYYCWYHLLP